MSKSAAIAVPQANDRETWGVPVSIPTDDSAVLTTFLPLATLLVVYGAILLCSLRPNVCDPSAVTPMLSRTP